MPPPLAARECIRSDDGASGGGLIHDKSGLGLGTPDLEPQPPLLLARARPMCVEQHSPQDFPCPITQTFSPASSPSSSSSRTAANAASTSIRACCASAS